ncbi:trypsin-like peptidase domain-containing protein [Streptomyces sp. NPDC006339]|uniref:VMAP-C domain-containing protein n=1 Tax=Streptomyces sp. NPDC006339 TaxID=3156755 RepID=UPI0033BA058B
MPSSAWHARVDHAGEVLGSAFLVAPGTLLTCAHVVADLDRVSVRFPGAQGLGELPARVAVRGPWGGSPTDPGDVAVLALERPVDVAPARFARPEGLREVCEPPRLVAYGFPEGYETEGAQAELRMTLPGQLIQDEWSQVECLAGHGQRPSHGFSGAAAVRADDGTVVGMIAAYDPTAPNARIIPARVLARHVPALAELVDTPGCSAEEKRWLRELVERAERTERIERAGGTERAGPAGATRLPLERLLRAAVGPLAPLPPPAAHAGLWPCVWYLITESRPADDRVPLAELAVRLADQVADEELRRAFRAWAREHRARAHRHLSRPGHATAPAGAEPPCTTAGAGAAAPHPSAPPDRPHHPAPPHSPPSRNPPDPDATDRDAPDRDAPPWSPILVEVRRSGADPETVLAEVSVHRHGERILVSEQQVAKAELRAWVCDRIDEAYHDIVDGRPLVAFALPRGWLNKNVDQWRRRRREQPLGCLVPVVVLDHDRRAKGRHQYELRRMWGELERQKRSSLYRMPCVTERAPAQIAVLLQDVRGPVGFTRPPTAAHARKLHDAALDAPAPIVLWPRTGCPPGGPCTGDCRGAGFLARIAEWIATAPPYELPEVIRQLRRKAFTAEGPEPHWAASGVSLVWEDPRCFADVRPLRGSPVG